MLEKEIGREKISEPNLEMKQQMYEFYKMTFNSCFTERLYSRGILW
jgi:hypothetical protein